MTLNNKIGFTKITQKNKQIDHSLFHRESSFAFSNASSVLI